MTDTPSPNVSRETIDEVIDAVVAGLKGHPQYRKEPTMTDTTQRPDADRTEQRALASMLCPFHFVLHDSGRTDLPTFPCVTNCRANGLGRATSRFLLSGIAESVENVLHVARLPYRCMTSSQLTRL